MRKLLHRDLVLLAIGLAACIAGQAPSATAVPACPFIVDRGGGGTHLTIQAAVNDLPDPGPCDVLVKDGTYHESVKVSGRNVRATDPGQTIHIFAEHPGLAIVTPSGLPGPARLHAFFIEQSKFITIQGFKLTGTTQEAIFVRGGEAFTNRDVTITGNEITGNGSASKSGGIHVARENPNTRISDNSIHHNFRNGVEIEGDDRYPPDVGEDPDEGSPKILSNNRICGNGWNGVSVGRTNKDMITLSQNEIYCNGKATGTTGGRFGVLRQLVGSGPGFRDFIVLDGNELCSNARGDIGNVKQTLGPPDNDHGNVTTHGDEESACVSSGCSGAIAGRCLVTDCRALCP